MELVGYFSTLSVLVALNRAILNRAIQSRAIPRLL